MKTYKVKLQFTAPLHISARGVKLERVNEELHSDTLFGAIVHAWSMLYPDEVATLFDPVEKKPPFLLSSAFPFFKDEMNEWEFYPRPLSSQLYHENNDDPAIRKQIKKVEYLERDLFGKAVQGEKVHFKPENTLANGKYLLTSPPPYEHFVLKSVETPRVVVDRATNVANNYFVSEVYFEEKSGFFFLLQINDETIEKKLFAALQLLGDEGIGLDRTSGKGFFEFGEAIPESLPSPASANGFVTLSLYSPRAKEVTQTSLLTKTWYEIVKREGWITSRCGTPFRRKSVHMFVEGSVFSAKPDNILGELKTVLSPSDVRDKINHPVYRYGYAFPVPMKIEA